MTSRQMTPAEIKARKAEILAEIEASRPVEEVREPELPKGLTRWLEMNLAERIEVMNKVPYCKSEAKRFRAIIAYLEKN